MALPEKIQKQRNELVNRVIEDIESGKPFFWDSGHYGRQPRNLLKALQGEDCYYQGINNVKLTVMTKAFGFKDSRWATFKQAQAIGGRVKKGAKGTHIEFWQYVKDVMKMNPETGKKEPVYEIDPDTGEKKKKQIALNPPLVKSYVVFNGDQIEGIPKEDRAAAIKAEDVNNTMENMLQNSEAEIYYDQRSKNFYSPSKDAIHVMPRDMFKTLEAFYSTCAHEIAHSTGAEKRLNRKTLTDFDGFGGETYAREELRAELASMFLAQKYSVKFDESHYKNHAAYLKSWAKVLKNDPNEIFRAAVDAEKAMRYIEKNMINIQITDELKKSEDIDENKIRNITKFTPQSAVLSASQTYLLTAQNLLKANGGVWRKEFNAQIIKKLASSGKNIFDIKNAVIKHSPNKVTDEELHEMTKQIEKTRSLAR